MQRSLVHGQVALMLCAVHKLAIVVRGTREVILPMVARKEGGRGQEREGRMEGREGGKKTKSTQGSTPFRSLSRA